VEDFDRRGARGAAILLGPIVLSGLLFLSAGLEVPAIAAFVAGVYLLVVVIIGWRRHYR
jgi:hypothetical protein